jgi:hypothetical protein
MVKVLENKRSVMPMLNTFVRLKFVRHAKPLKYDTSNQLWHSESLLETPQSVSEVMTQLNDTIANQDHWTRQRLDGAGDGTSAWTISSETWGNWKASVHTEVASDTNDRVGVIIQVDDWHVIVEIESFPPTIAGPKLQRSITHSGSAEGRVGGCPYQQLTMLKSGDDDREKRVNSGNYSDPRASQCPMLTARGDAFD